MLGFQLAEAVFSTGMGRERTGGSGAIERVKPTFGADQTPLRKLISAAAKCPVDTLPTPAANPHAIFGQSSPKSASPTTYFRCRG